MRYNLYQARSNCATNSMLALPAGRKSYFPSGQSRAMLSSPCRSETLHKLSLTIAIDEMSGMIVSMHIGRT